MPSHHRPAVHRWQRYVATFGGAVIVLMAGVLTYGALRRARDARQLVVRTHYVIETIASTISALQDAESGQRGFLIAGADSYLEPYHRALSALDRDTTALRRLTRGNPAHQARLDTLATLIGAKTDELRQTIDLRRETNSEIAAEIVRTGRGEETMKSIRRVLGAMQAEEAARVVSQQTAETRRMQVVTVILLVAGLAAAGIGIIVNALLIHDADAQARLASDLSVRNSWLLEHGNRRERDRHHLKRSTDDLRRRTEDAERASAAKSDFLAALSHELRTPLNAILGYVDLLTMGVRGPVADTQQEDLRRIRRSGEHLLSLIDETRNLARVEAGQLELNITGVRVAEFLGDLMAFVGPQMEQKGLAYAVMPCDRTLVAFIDVERTRQILLNLLTNAQKFTDRGGRIVVECDTAMRADSEPPDVAEMLWIRVADSGRGIPVEKLTTIFDPFVQVDRRLTPDGEQGLGLGLAISRDLARAMGGDLTVESVVGRGSTFTLQLPADGRDGHTERTRTDDSATQNDVSANTLDQQPSRV